MALTFGSAAEGGDSSRHEDTGSTLQAGVPKTRVVRVLGWRRGLRRILISTSWPRALRKCMSLSAEKPLKISKQHSAVSIQPRQKPASRDDVSVIERSDQVLIFDEVRRGRQSLNCE